MRSPFALALDSAGNNIDASMAMMAITTSNSISVKALRIPSDALAAIVAGELRSLLSGGQKVGVVLFIVVSR